MIKRKEDGNIVFSARTTREGHVAVTGNSHVEGRKLIMSDEILRIDDVAHETVNNVRAYGNVYSGIGDIIITSKGVKIPLPA